MSAASSLLARLLRLPPAETRDVTVQRDLAVPMRDGAVLRADRHAPAGRGDAPLVLVRSPYGRGLPWRLLFGRLLAERGYQVVVQSCRGTHGSQGSFDPFAEHDDGVDTLSWLREQPWYPGLLGMVGPSYLGMAQWTVADAAPDELVALAVGVATAQPGRSLFPGGALALEWPLRWSVLLAAQEDRGAGLTTMAWANVVAGRRLARGAAHRPLGEADEVATGRSRRWWRDWLAHPDPDEPFWAPRDHRDRVPRTTAAVLAVTGWDDLFAPWQLDEWALLPAAAGPHRLVVTSGGHDDNARVALALREALAWFDHHLRGRPDRLPGGPVRYEVTGAGRWHDASAWPPSEAAAQRWHLHADGGLSPAPPHEGPPSRYRFDPADPTPAAGGPRLTGAARVRQDRVEAREDVRVFTSAALQAPLEVAGEVGATVHLRSSREHTDVVVRLCDVDPRGRSTHVCDGIRRIGAGQPAADADGVRAVDVDLWPAAHCFKAGHRVRVHVASGAFPRFEPNPGTGEPAATATQLVAADQEVAHDPARPSHLRLPVIHRR